MASKTARMQQIEAMLADDPKDAFLRYGLAMEYVGQGDDEMAARLLADLIGDQPYVPAYLQAGQALSRLGRDSEAIEVLKHGIEAAQQQRNDHAAGEMQGLLSSLE